MAIIGAESGSYTPSDVERKRKFAAMLLQGDRPAREPFGALAQGLRGALAGWNEYEAGEAESKGRNTVAELLKSGDYKGALGSEWASPNQSAIASMLQGREWNQQDQQANWAREDARFAQQQGMADWQTLESGGDVYRWNAKDPNSTPSLFFDGPDQPSGFRPMTAEEKAAAGLPADVPAQIGPDGKIDVIGGSGVKVDVNNMGTIPPGYSVEYDASGNPLKMNAIPGSPAYLEEQSKLAEMKAAAEKAKLGEGRRDTNTDTIISAASIARDLASKPGNAGLVGAVMSNLSETDAAELRRQVGVLTANATIENLTAMRQASPTGGALGSVTEKEGAMLAAAAGAIDPNAKPADFARALDNYERTLLRIIHGPAKGDSIFEETRKIPTAAGTQANIQSLLDKYKD